MTNFALIEKIQTVGVRAQVRTVRFEIERQLSTTVNSLRCGCVFFVYEP